MAYMIDRKEYPFKSNYLMIDGHRMHYIDEGQGETILFVHGTPSWSFDFRHQIRELRKEYRCIALDHIGFGLSDKPADYPYSCLQHSRNLSKLIDSLKIDRLHLVVHDFGGPIALQVATLEPERFSKLIILNSWMWNTEDDPGYLKLKRTLKSPLVPILYRYFNFSARYLLPASFGKKKLSKDLLQNYRSVFAGPDERNGCLAFARGLLQEQSYFASIWNRRAALADKQALLIWGLQDRFIHSAYLERFQQVFLNAQLLRLPDCGHFPQEEEAEIVSRAIQQFLKA